MNRELISVPRTTLDIYFIKENDLEIYEFDATECSPPEPMVNATVLLNKLKNENERVRVKFFHEPTPLYQKIEQHFEYESTELESGDFLVTFRKKG